MIAQTFLYKLYVLKITPVEKICPDYTTGTFTDIHKMGTKNTQTWKNNLWTTQSSVP